MAWRRAATVDSHAGCGLGRGQEEVHGRHADVDDEDDGADGGRERGELVERRGVTGHGLADRAVVRVDDRDPRVDDAADDVGDHLRAALEPARARGGGLDALVDHLLDGVDEEPACLGLRSRRARGGVAGGRAAGAVAARGGSRLRRHTRAAAALMGRRAAGRRGGARAAAGA